MNMSAVIRQGALEIARMSSNLVLLTKQQLSYLEQRGGEDYDPDSSEKAVS